MPVPQVDLRFVMKRPFCENNLVAPVSVTDVTPFSAKLTIMAAEPDRPSLAGTLKLICGHYALKVLPATEEEVRAQIERVHGDYCQICGAPTGEGLRRCDNCRSVSLAAPQITLEVDFHPVRVTGKLCPYCQTTLASGARTRVCPLCGMPHHAECWSANGGCTTFGCGGLGVDPGGYNEQYWTPSPARMDPREWYGLGPDRSDKDGLFFVIVVLLVIGLVWATLAVNNHDEMLHRSYPYALLHMPVVGRTAPRISIP